MNNEDGSSLEDNQYTIRNCVFGFSCSSDWEQMRTLDFSDTGGEIRFCDNCQKEVYECLDDDELTRNIKLNRCITILKHDSTDEFRLSGYIRLEK